jgi:hypothetical protein
MHFTEHLADAFGKLPRESNSNHETSSPLFRWHENNTGFHLQEFTLQQQIDTALQAFCWTLGDHSQDDSQKTEMKQEKLTHPQWPAQGTSHPAETPSSDQGGETLETPDLHEVGSSYRERRGVLTRGLSPNGRRPKHGSN